MAMRMEFGPDDDKAFEAARDDLLDGFSKWFATQGVAGSPDELASGASVALDWKWGYGDGAMTLWRPADLAEFLMEWCPRKLTIPPEEHETIPRALAAFLRFLDATGMADRRSAPLVGLLATLEDLVPEYLAGMGDPSKFGMAKSLFATAAAEGVDLSDPDQVEGWIGEFNARSFDERRAVLPDRFVGRPTSRQSLPPVAQPDEEALRRSVEAARALPMLTGLADHLGEGRRLTQKGHLTLADARALVELLDTADVTEEVIGKRTFRVSSSDELPVLRLLFAWAKKAGLVRVVHGRAMATKAGRRLARDPVALFERCVRALLKLGPVSAQRYPDSWFAWPEVDALLDRLTLPLLAGPYVAQRPIPLEILASEMTGAVLQAFILPNLSDDQVRTRVAGDVTDIVEALELAGVVVRTGTEPSEYGRRRNGGTVQVTPAGTHVLRRLLGEAGYEAPAAGRFAEGPAIDLLRQAESLGLPAVLGELEAWRRRRSPEEAARELVDAVRTLDDPGLRRLACAAIVDLGTEAAVPALQELLSEPGTRGLAACALVDSGVEPASSLFDPDDHELVVEVLAHRALSDQPQRLIDTLALAGSHEQQIQVIGRFWRVPSPATLAALEAIGRGHPIRAVAKAARRAVLQHRSWLANR